MEISSYLMPEAGKRERVHPYLDVGGANGSYAAAVKVREERYAALLSLGVIWRRIALVAIIAVCCLSVGLVLLALRRKEVPYVVAVDKWGYSVPIGKASEETEGRFVEFHLREFVRLSRGVSSDGFSMEQGFKRAYRFVKKGSAAWVYLNEFYQEEQKPFEQAEKQLVYVDDISVIRVSEVTWRVRWSEVARSVGGRELGVRRMWGEFQINLYPIDEPEALIENPIGMQIENLTWARE